MGTEGTEHTAASLVRRRFPAFRAYASLLDLFANLVNT